jgi:FMN phosphatase YigB (HAD superfamily)
MSPERSRSELTNPLILCAEPFQLAILDLDGTLYDETAYLFQAYRDIAADVARAHAIPAEEVFGFLRDRFAAQGRERLFDAMIGRYGLPPSYLEVALSLLRNAHVPGGLQLFPLLHDFLSHAASKGKTVAVLTNGNVVQQRNKLGQLGLEERFAVPVYFADEITRKPAPDAALRILQDFNCAAGSAVLIGNGVEDEHCARAAAIRYIDVSRFLLPAASC